MGISRQLIDGELGAQRKDNVGISNLERDARMAEMARDHAHDLIQPYTPDGKPNPDFINMYPEAAKDYGFLDGEERTV